MEKPKISRIANQFSPFPMQPEQPLTVDLHHSYYEVDFWGCRQKKIFPQLQYGLLRAPLRCGRQKPGG